MTFLTRPFSSLLTGAALSALLALPVMAQDTAEATDTPAEPATETPAETPAADGSGFAMGEPVDEDGNPIAQEPQVGEQYLANLHTDWAIRCLKTEDGNDPCQMYQLLNDESDNSVAEIAIVPLAGGGNAVAGATIVVPLETLLTEQLTLRVDGGQARRVPFNFCNVGGCVTRLGLTNEDLNLFKGGAAATLTLVPAAAPDQRVTVTMSLSGFTAAFEEVSAQ